MIGKTIVIHCADTPNGASDERFSIHDINDWHRARNFVRDDDMTAQWQPQFHHVGYHGVIHTSGLYIPARGLDERGAHCAGMNAGSWGVCLMGKDKFTPRQWETLARTVRRWMSFGARRVIGHRDHNRAKMCPGFDVSRWMREGLHPLGAHMA